jgi:predicted HTH domain antitoxin
MTSVLGEEVASPGRRALPKILTCDSPSLRAVTGGIRIGGSARCSPWRLGGLGVRRSRDTMVTMATLEIPQEVLGVLGADPARAAGEIRLLAAMKLFELGRLSSGAAATLAGVARVEFLTKLGEYGVSPFQVSPEDLEQDLENARHASRRS